MSVFFADEELLRDIVDDVVATGRTDNVNRGLIVHAFQKVKEQRGELLEVCDNLCSAIKLVGSSKCNMVYDGPILEFIEEHWIRHVAGCLGDAYQEAQDVMERISNETSS